MPTKAITQRRILDPIIGSRVGLYNALQALKTQHGVLEPVEYPHEISRGVWRAVVAVPDMTPRNIAGRNKIKIVVRPKVIGLTLLGLVAGGLATAVVIWVIAHWTLVLSALAVLAILASCVSGRRFCTHADHH